MARLPAQSSSFYLNVSALVYSSIKPFVGRTVKAPARVPLFLLTNRGKTIFIHREEFFMEEMEITSWLTLDAIKKSKAAEIVESVGNLQTDQSISVFCVIEDDYLELLYSDSTANSLRRYEDHDEFEQALEERKEEAGETPHEDEEERDYDEDKEDEDEAEFDAEDETGAY
jgi:hypothetical protein